MRILFLSYAFYPSCGGIESSARLLIREFIAAGHEVKVVTETCLGSEAEIDECPVFRQISPIGQLRLGGWADVVYQHNPSMRLCFAYLVNRSFIVSIRTWLRRVDGRVSLVDRLKRAWIKRTTVIANSRASADDVDFPSVVIENAYDDETFLQFSTSGKRSGAAFVGRLVSDKGVDEAIQAIALLKARGLDLNLEVIGDGEARSDLEVLVEEAGVEDLVHFNGVQKPEEIAGILNRVRYLLIPSRWSEPFGIVALEGIACGCIPLGTDHGGLVDAIGGCGPLYKSGNPEALADELMSLESSAEKRASFEVMQKAHLETHSPKFVASRYLELFEDARRN